MRVIILEKPKIIKTEPKQLIFLVGDRNGHKAKVYVGLSQDDESEKEFAANLVKDSELLIFCGKFRNLGKSVVNDLYFNCYF